MSQSGMRIKICGITRPEDAELAGTAGANAIGLIFVAGSSRHVTLIQAREIRQAAEPFLNVVGVFRDAPLQQVLDTAAALQLPLVQLHGSEDAAYVRRVARHVRVIRALPFTAQLSRKEAQAVPGSALLLDAVTPGSGKPFDWRQATVLAGLPRLILAGGLNPANVAEAIRLLNPQAVDVASGVEAAPGVKDPELVRSFIRQARQAGNENRASQC